MKITKHGKKYKKENSDTEEFVCSNCQCEFDAKPDEYYTDCNASSISESGSITFSTTAEDRLVCSCPECHKICKKTKYRNAYTPWTVTYDSTATNKPLVVDRSSVITSSNKTDPNK